MIYCIIDERGAFMKKEKKTKIKKELTVEQKETKTKKIINIVFIVIVVLLVLITVDVICVSRFQVGPFFAIRTNVYKDGGSKVYYGLGYKVIKYNQIEGKHGMQIGLWTMPYTAEATPIDILDLAIAYRNNPKKTYQKYYDQFLKLTGTIHEIDKEKKTITIRYTDPDGKYTLDVVGTMYEKSVDLSTYQVGETISFVGSVSGYKDKTDQIPNQILMRDCFIKEES